MTLKLDLDQDGEDDVTIDLSKLKKFIIASTASLGALIAAIMSLV